MEKPGLDKIIIFISIVLVPLLGLTVIPKILFRMFQSKVSTLMDDKYYTTSLVVALVMFLFILVLSVYIVLKPYILWGLAYGCGILYAILLFLKPGEDFNSLNFYIIVISYMVDLVVLLAVSLKEKK